MNRFYPYGIWCNKYGMWCDDVVEITEGNNDCNGDCMDCSESEDMKEAQHER